MQNNTKYLIALSQFSKFGPVRLKKIRNYFENYEKAFSANLEELIKAGIEEKIALEFLSEKPAINIEKILNKIDQENIKITTIDDKLYPKQLKEIYDPPVLLYYKGDLKNSLDYSIGVVGTRKFTHYGKEATEKIVNTLAINNISIISGLALGIDTIAHTATLEAKGHTIAVLGTGLDQQSIYPSSNRFLANKIISNGGAVITEFSLETPPLRYNFPQRNRIISGLSLGTLVVEAGEKSGALITARYALEQNREVFAVPGSIFSPVSKGPNNLIKQGAKTVTNAEDILETLDLVNISTYIDNKKIIPETKEEEIIINHLSHEPIHVNELIRLTNQSTSAINSTLTIMEMKGSVKNIGGMQYILAR